MGGVATPSLGEGRAPLLQAPKQNQPPPPQTRRVYYILLLKKYLIKFNL